MNYMCCMIYTVEIRKKPCVFGRKFYVGHCDFLKWPVLPGVERLGDFTCAVCIVRLDLVAFRSFIITLHILYIHILVSQLCYPYLYSDYL